MATDDRRVFFDTFPRNETYYCYVCNKPTTILRTEGDLNKLRVALAKECRDNFISTNHVTMFPRLCGSTACRRVYDTLPATRYREEKVLYLDEVQFDGGSFFDFPTRTERPELVNESAGYRINSEFMLEGAYKLQPLFQAWLFFGFLHEILGDLYVAEDHIRVDSDNDRVLTIARLIEILPTWMRTVSKGTEQGMADIRRFNDAIELVQKSFTGVRGNFDPATWCIIGISAELVARAVKDIMLPISVDSLAFGTCEPRSPVALLQSIGWCPHIANLFSRPLVRLIPWMLYSRLERHDPQADHSKCTEHECLLHKRINSLQQGSSHHPGCPDTTTCTEIGIDDATMHRICSMISTGTLPLLRIVEDASGKAYALQLIPHKPDMSYFAISHVWSQGLGNEDDNSLKRCNLTRLLKYLKRLSTSISPDGSSEVIPIWLDTLCCPVAHRAIGNSRQQALKLMRSIYQNAEGVLVVDTELECLDSRSYSPVELGAYIFSASWNWRLWTYQEGALPRELWFQLADRALNDTVLFLAMRQISQGDNMRDRIAAQDVANLYLNLRTLSNRYAMAKEDSELSTMLLMKGMVGRAVTHARDEAFCISTLLNLDPTPIFETEDPQQRMMILWKMLSDAGLVSRKIAFHVGRKMEITGWSWALSTLCQPGSPAGFLQHKTRPASITPEGLLIRGSGFVLGLPSGETPPLPGESLGVEYATRMGFLDTIYVKIAEERWCFLKPGDTSLEEHYGVRPHGKQPALNTLWWESRREYAVIRELFEDEVQAIKTNHYLLVEIHARNEERILCKGVRLVDISKPLYGNVNLGAVLNLSTDKYPSVSESIQDDTQQWVLL